MKVLEVKFKERTSTYLVNLAVLINKLLFIKDLLYGLTLIHSNPLD
jgi:hypothetical protein